MEASENAGTPLEGRGGPELHRIDLDRVRQALRDPTADGYARLQLMVGAVIPRLTAAGGRENRR